MVGDEDDKAVRGVLTEVPEELRFRGLVKRRGGFVEEEDTPRTKERAGDSDTLCLPFGEAQPALTDGRVKPLRQVKHEVRDSQMQHLMQVGLRSELIAEEEILTDRPAEERAALRDVDEVGARRLAHHIATATRVEADSPLDRRDEPKQ